MSDRKQPTQPASGRQPTTAGGATSRATGGWRPASRSLSQPTYRGSSYRGSTYRGTTAGYASARGRSRRLGRQLSTRTVGVVAVLGLGLAVVVGMALARSRADQPVWARPEVAVLEMTRGAVRLEPSNSASGTRMLTMATGQPIHAGTVLDTRSVAGRGAVGRAAFRLAGGASVRLDADSRVRAASPTALILERGAVYVDAARGASIEVRTSLGVVRDIGTQFEVRLLPDGPSGAASNGLPASAEQEALRIRVREGVVEHEKDGVVTRADAGEQLSVQGAGTVGRGLVLRYGPDWAWVLDTAPVPPLEGRTLAWFLDWKAREGGWTLRYEGPETARLAGEIILHGDAAGLDPTAAATMVFEGSGLRYRVTGGELHVASAGSV